MGRMDRRAFLRASIGTGVAAAFVVGSGRFARAQDTTPAAGTEAMIRVVHASPDAPAVDIYVNGSKALSNLAFKEVSPWTPLPGGSYDVKVTAAGQTEGVIEASSPSRAASTTAWWPSAGWLISRPRWSRII